MYGNLKNVCECKKPLWIQKKFMNSKHVHEFVLKVVNLENVCEFKKCSRIKKKSWIRKSSWIQKKSCLVN